MAQANKNAISPTRGEDYPEWYQQVIKAADMAENSSVRGCMVIKPWGYGIWEKLQYELDSRIKATGHENAYFPLFIPISYLEKEASHVEGFAKECAVVTHHRLEERDGKLVPTGELDEPLIVRPTSETIIGESFAKWIQSYRDLPLLINQWANVVRWEMRTRLFLRTAEFLWQEGHTAHESQEDAMEETYRMLEVYRELAEDVLAIPVIPGEKTAGERFPGAVRTFTIEAMMQDRKALQAGTSHYLGQNFAKAANIAFLNREGESVFAHTTSWGVSTRMVGGLVMTHGDDDGLRVPPLVAPHQIVVLPITPKEDSAPQVFEYADEIARACSQQRFRGAPVRVKLDTRDLRGGDKAWQWVKKGAPLRVEIGPRDLGERKVVVYRRDQGVKDKIFLTFDEFVSKLPGLLEEVQRGLFEQAKKLRDENIVNGMESFDELVEFFTPQNREKPEIHGGFVLAPLSDSPKVEEHLGTHKLTVRCIPLGPKGECSGERCLVTGEPAAYKAYIAKAY